MSDTAASATARLQLPLITPLEYRAHPIRQYPDMALRHHCASVTEERLEFASALGRRMEHMVEAAGALGLAAPQVGGGLRVFAYRREDESLWTAINPILELAGELELGIEGCLSLGQLLTHVARPADVRMRAVGADGEEYVYEASGLWGRVLQHEADHLDGRLILDIGVDVPLLSTLTRDPVLGFVRPRPLLEPLEARVSQLLAQARAKAAREEQEAREAQEWADWDEAQK